MKAKRSFRTFAFQQWFRLSRPMTLGVRGVVQDSEGQVLLLKHTYTAGWHFPGGGVERGEPAETALEREMLEEAGIQITERPSLHGVFSNHDIFRNDHVLVFRIRDYRETEPTSVNEIAEIGWFDPADIPDDTTPGTRARLHEIIRREPPARFWTPQGETGLTIS